MTNSRIPADRADPSAFDIRHSQFNIPAIAVLGTASHVGKSVIAAGLCRILRRRGVRVAPFKAQNMSLNAAVTPDGGEIGRAQALQAEACGLPPTVDMNPILLKPEADSRSQVVVQGRVLGTRSAADYFRELPDLFPRVRESYARLAAAHEAIVIEGAGSCAEVNLRDRDLVNWRTVEMADARAVLVADIDRGGVFAQVIGTIDLLAPEERRRLIGVIVNRFRGDASLFADGVRFLEERTGLPVLGVIPFLRDLSLDEEDAVSVDGVPRVPFGPDRVNVAVVLLPRMSNFTDFRALAAEPDVALRYAARPAELEGADAVILPGSKNTIADLARLAGVGFPGALRGHVDLGGELVGLCGGYQMLGRSIADPHGVEAGGPEPEPSRARFRASTIDGLAFLDVATELSAEKTLTRVEARSLDVEAAPGETVSGYEIHAGRTLRVGDRPCFRIRRSDGTETEDGAARADGRVWGTYLHGVFDRPSFRRRWLNRLRRRKGLAPLDAAVSEATTVRLGEALDRWADHLERHLRLATILPAPECRTPNSE